MEQFDYQFYYNFYPDLHKYNINTPEKLLEHYKIYGKNENRVKNKLELLRRCKFNPDIYRYNYEDLQNMTDLELENHFIMYGIKEKRNSFIYEDKNIDGKLFNIGVYRNNNSDLHGLNDTQLLNHFKKIGKNEKRIISNKNSLKKENNIVKKINKERTVEQFKILHREKCLNCLAIIRNIIIPEFGFDSSKETLLIEFRCLPHIEFLLRNVIIKLPFWKHTVVCGNNNYNLIKSICENITFGIKSKINIIKLNIYNLTPSEYSDLLTNELFWNRLKGEKILIYQEDSILFHNNIQQFLKYDYIGAPWPKEQDDNSLGVGNGGFSLRSKSKLLKCLRNVDINELELGEHTIKYMKNTCTTYIPEDVYFSKSMIDYNIGLVASRKIASQFSQETIKSNNPLGGHQFWLGDNFDNYIYISNYRLIDDYYQSVTHRGGWKSVINNLKNNNIICKKEENNSIILVDCCESYFIWNENYEKIERPWVGIVHFCPDLPHFIEGEDLNKLLENERFIQALEYCNCLITLSQYLQDYLSLKLPNIKIITIKHPIETIKSKFSLEKFLNNKEKCLLQLGFQSRIISTIFRVSTNYKKILLTGRNDFNENDILNRVKKEVEYLELKDLDLEEKDINMFYFDNFEEFDELLINSIIIIPLWNASANNSILEIIELQVPCFITRLQSTEEYLGKDYPMFYEDVAEISEILKDSEKLVSIYTKAYEYLRNLDRSILQYDYFNSELLKIIN